MHCMHLHMHTKQCTCARSPPDTPLSIYTHLHTHTSSALVHAHLQASPMHACASPHVPYRIHTSPHVQAARLCALIHRHSLMQPTPKHYVCTCIHARTQAMRLCTLTPRCPLCMHVHPNTHTSSARVHAHPQASPMHVHASTHEPKLSACARSPSGTPSCMRMHLHTCAGNELVHTHPLCSMHVHACTAGTASPLGRFQGAASTHTPAVHPHIYLLLCLHLHSCMPFLYKLAFGKSRPDLLVLCAAG